MKIFLDTAETDVIRKNFVTGLVDGLTTNPTLIMKSGRQPDDVYKELIQLGIKDISMEVVDHSAAGMVAEAHRLVELHGKECTTIKVPCTPDGLMTCKAVSYTHLTLPTICSV